MIDPDRLQMGVGDGGDMTEREKIVAYLRHLAAEAWGMTEEEHAYETAANAIERLDHLTWTPERTVKADTWMGESSVGY